MVKRALAGLPGIRQVDVSLAEAKAWVTYNPTEVTVDEMVRTIVQAGFEARALSGG